MEIEGLTAGIQVKGTKSQTPLTVGDQLIGRVVRRLRPFSYLIAFRGKTFPVNSSVFLEDNQKVLLELVETKPRLKFKLLSTLPNSHKLMVAKWLKILNLPENSINKSVMSWVLRLGLSVDREEFAFLSSLFSKEKGLLQSYPDLLAAYLLVRWQQANQMLPQSHEIFRYLFIHVQKLPKKSAGQLNEQEKSPILWDEFSELFLEAKPLLKLIRRFLNPFEAEGFLQKNTEEWKHNGQDKPSDEAFTWQLKTFLHLERLWRAGEWVCFPFFQKHSGKKFFTFWRRKGSGDNRQIEFTFSRSVENKVPFTVTGCLKQNVLDLEIISPSKVFLNLAEKYNSILVSQLKKSDLCLGVLNLMEKDEDWGVANILFKEQLNHKIEALI